MPQYRVKYEYVEYVTDYFTDINGDDYLDEVPDYYDDEVVVTADDDDAARAKAYDQLIDYHDGVSVGTVTLEEYED